MQHLISSMEDKDFMTRKAAIDSIIAFAKAHPLCLVSYKRELYDILSELKCDKIKPVREASMEALNIFKESTDLAINEEELKKDSQMKDLTPKDDTSATNQND